MQAAILPSASVRGELIDRGRRANVDAGEALVATRPLEGTAADHKVGAWTCTPGGWMVIDRPDAETFFVLEGRATLTDGDGDGDGVARDIGPGDLVHLPVGWTGRWDVSEPMRKVYVIVS